MLVARLAAGAAAALVAGAAPAATSTPRTLLSVAGGIGVFAQDAGSIAWTSGGSSCFPVHVRRAAGGTVATVGDTDGGDGCIFPDAFAVAAGRVLWGGFEDCCIEGYGSVEVDARKTKPAQLVGLGQDYHAWGDYLTGAAGDGALLVFSTTTIELSKGKEVDPARGFVHCLPRDPCTWDVTGGGVWRVVGRKAVRIAGTPPTALVAAAAGRIAVVPADTSRFPGPCSNEQRTGCPAVRVAAGAAVQVRSAASGAVVATFAPAGRVAAIALTRAYAAVLVRTESSATVDRYDAATGARLGSTRVANDVANALHAAGSSVVYRRGKTIWLLNAATGRASVLARVRATPVGLSIAGTRVAWAENVRGRGYVRAVGVR